jgi:fatty-acyl-CoA synthase
VKALIVLKTNSSNTKPADITDWARDKMAAYKVPRLVEFVEQLPKTPTGKILWRELQEKERRK